MHYSMCLCLHSYSWVAWKFCCSVPCLNITWQSSSIVFVRSYSGDWCSLEAKNSFLIFYDLNYTVSWCNTSMEGMNFFVAMPHFCPSFILLVRHHWFGLVPVNCGCQSHWLKVLYHVIHLNSVLKTALLFSVAYFI